MSALSTNRIVPRDGLVSGASGGIIQIKWMQLTGSSFTTQSTSMVDVTNFNLSITPTRSDNKIMVLVNARVSCTTPDGNQINKRMSINLLRGSSQIGSQFFGEYYAGTGGTDLNTYGNISIHCLDTPATTSSVTYKIQISSDSGGSTAVVGAGSYSQSTITLMEVSG